MKAQKLIVLLGALFSGSLALQPVPALRARRVRTPVCAMDPSTEAEAPDEATTDTKLDAVAEATSEATSEAPPGFFSGFSAAAGLAANPVVFLSLYDVAASGTGLDPGPYGLVGALEGVSFLVVASFVVASAYSKVTTGSGLPAGPLGLLGLAEGLTFLSLIGALLVFPLRELGVIGDPATSILDVPALTASLAVTVLPLLSSVRDAIAAAVGTVSLEGLSVPQGISADGMSLPTLEGLQAPSLPDGVTLPSLEGLKASISSLSLPTISLPDAPLSLPDGLSVPSLPKGLSLPSLPEGISMPSMPQLPDGIPSDALTSSPVSSE